MPKGKTMFDYKIKFESGKTEVFTAECMKDLLAKLRNTLKDAINNIVSIKLLGYSGTEKDYV